MTWAHTPHNLVQYFIMHELLPVMVPSSLYFDSSRCIISHGVNEKVDQTVEM